MPFIMTRVHGHAFVAQRGLTLDTIVDGTGGVTGVAVPPDLGVPFGHGRVFSGARGSECWFHVPIPTIAQLEGSPLYLDQFFVFFTCKEGEPGTIVAIRRVHVWDGSARGSMFDLATPMVGNWSTPRTLGANSNTWFPRSDAGQRIRIFTGLGISLLGTFEGAGIITFHSAGANWVDSPR